MIFDHLSRAATYQPISARLAAAYGYLATFDRATPNGRIELDGKCLYAVVQRYPTSPAAARDWEVHRRYIDVQCLFSGREVIQFARSEDLECIKTYDVAGDYELYRGPAMSQVLLRPGEFAVFYPQEVHKPGCSVGDAEDVLKVVMKVLAE